MRKTDGLTAMALAVLMAAAICACDIKWEPPPDPEPTPTATPLPEPTPEPTPTPVVEPTPEPTAPPQPRCPSGKPQARGPHKHGNRRFDATPAVCRADWTPDCYTGRYCHPVACEGAASGDDREFCETQLMGGKEPVWELQDVRGNLQVYTADGGWFGYVSGRGTGKLRWCFPNGRACSKWLPVSY